MAEYQVPRILWESLESVLLAQGRIFVKDIAKRLEVDEKELLRRVMPSSKVKVYLHDTQTENLQCQAFVHTDSVTHRCRRAVLLGQPFCAEHFRDRLLVIEPTEENIVERIQDEPGRPPLWKRHDNTVIDSKGTVRGHYNEHSGKLILFEVE
jgi:hypothetical protein